MSKMIIYSKPAMSNPIVLQLFGTQNTFQGANFR